MKCDRVIVKFQPINIYIKELFTYKILQLTIYDFVDLVFVLFFICLNLERKKKNHSFEKLIQAGILISPSNHGMDKET